MKASDGGGCIHFGVFEFSPQAQELRKRGLKIKIGPLACKALALLLEEPGRMRTREELCERLWPAHTYVDFERGLNKTIHALRLALGDVAASPRYIETFAGEGYRFIPIMQFPRQLITSSTAQRFASLAVLPVACASSEPEYRSLAYQITSQLINALSKIPEIKVLAHSMVKRFPPGDRSPQSIGQDLGVRGLIFAELVRSNGDVILNVEFVEAATGVQLWGTQLKQRYEQAVANSERWIGPILRQIKALLIASETRVIPPKPVKDLHLKKTNEVVTRMKSPITILRPIEPALNVH
jgi:DNA-binding winged helix-turn-helix (wHTH) protein